MSDEQAPGGESRGFGERRRAGRGPRPQSGGGGRGPGYGGGSGGGGPRPPRRDFVPAAPRPRAAAMPEPESVKPARELLEQILERMGVSGANVRYYARTEGEYLEVDGPDLANLIGRHGHTLEALNLIFNNIINVGVRNHRRYYTIDAEGYRARRAEQLKTLALATLERVIRERRPIPLEPMLPSERKIVHIALAESPFVRTESEGVEPERRLVVFPKEA
jgi:spoIIIJ-associated protein